jgi:hypothetical protein
MSGAQNGNTAAVAKTKPPAPGQETRELLQRAAKGDEGSREAVRALLADGDRGRKLIESYGSPAKWLLQSVVGKAANRNIMVQEAASRKLDAVQTELEGPNPTPLERLLAERVCLCWFVVNWYEDAFIESIKGMSIPQASFHLGSINRAHARFLSAVKSLAQVRKLAPPVVQVNIAKNQVVAEVRP